MTSKMIFEEPLADNRFLSKDKLFHDENLTSSGLKLVRDLCYETTPGFMPPSAFGELMGTSFKEKTFVHINSTLPADWRKTVRDELADKRLPNPDFMVQTSEQSDAVLFSSLQISDFYRELCDTSINGLRFAPFWERQIGAVSWEKYFQDLFRRVGDTKSFDIQWKFIQLCLPTCERLCRHNIIRSPTCPRCHLKKETTIHLFQECKNVSNLWKYILNIVLKQGNINKEKFYRFTIIGLSDYPGHIDLTVENSLRDIALTAI